MNIDVEVLHELYTIMKQYVPGKDRQECADNLMSVMVDMLDDKSLKEISGADSFLGKAYAEYASDDYDDEYLEDDE